METDPDETRHNISESADKITLTTKVKRGTGTRDQDEVKVKVKGDDPYDTAEKLKHTLNGLATAGVTQTLRDTQPEDGE
jgi:hypothetical protein